MAASSSRSGSANKKKSSKSSTRRRTRSRSRSTDGGESDDNLDDDFDGGRGGGTVASESPLLLLKQVAFFWLALAAVGLAMYLADVRQKLSSSSSSSSETPPLTSVTRAMAPKSTTTDAVIAPPPPASPPSVIPTPNIPKTKLAIRDAPPEPEDWVDDSESWSPPDPTIQKLWDFVCNSQENADEEDSNLSVDGDPNQQQRSAAFCHRGLQIVGRSLRTTEPISPGTTLLEIPRSMQIWDLDAYRDPFIRRYLFKASHILNGNRLGTEAFLAAYLALEQKRAEENPSHFDPIRLAYLQSLPKRAELQRFHPVFQQKDAMKEMLGSRSSSFSIVQAYMNMAQAEYDAFVAVSPQFQSSITRMQYFEARVNVMSRVLNVGQPGKEEVMPGTFIGDEFENEDLLQDELFSYHDILGLNLTGCIALVPLADLLNHHPNPNTRFVYHARSSSSSTATATTLPTKSGRSLVVSASQSGGGIDLYSEPMVSYGTFSDAELFARYGFVNGDGSGATQISISYNHQILRLNISSPSPTQQYDYINTSGGGRPMTKFRNFHLRAVAKYLHFDDGYPECITGPASHPSESELKHLKLEHLLRIANDVDRWIILLPPRNQSSMPGKSIEAHKLRTLPDYQRHIYSEIEDQIHRIQETCRFMSLINSDFDGRAVEVLRENIDNPNFIIGPNISDSLEFRSFMCLSRWFGTTAVSLELQGSLANQYMRLMTMTGSDNVGNLAWTAQYVRFLEMEALQRAAALVFERVSRSWEDKKYNPEIEYTMKDDSCPDEFQTHLFKEEEDSLSPELSSLV